MSDSLMHHYNPMLLPSVSLQLLTYWLAILPNIQASYPSVLGWNFRAFIFVHCLYSIQPKFIYFFYFFYFLGQGSPLICSQRWKRIWCWKLCIWCKGVCRICGFWVAFNMLCRSRWKLSDTYRFEPFKAIGIALESHLISSNRFTNTLTILSFYCMQWKPFGYRYRLLPVSFVESEAQGYLQNVHSNELLTGRWWNLILYLEFFKRNNKVDILILKNT